MGDVIDLKKRKTWMDLKERIQSGDVLLPPAPQIEPWQPQSDFGMAFAYMIEGLKNRGQP